MCITIVCVILAVCAVFTYRLLYICMSVLCMYVCWCVCVLCIANVISCFSAWHCSYLCAVFSYSKQIAYQGDALTFRMLYVYILCVCMCVCICECMLYAYFVLSSLFRAFLSLYVYVYCESTLLKVVFLSDECSI